MALNASVLGTSLYNFAQQSNDKEINDEDLDQARRDFWNGIATVIVSHIQTNGTVPALGLIASTGAVTGVAKIL